MMLRVIGNENVTIRIHREIRNDKEGIMCRIVMEIGTIGHREGIDHEHDRNREDGIMEGITGAEIEGEGMKGTVVEVGEDMAVDIRM